MSIRQISIAACFCVLGLVPGIVPAAVESQTPEAVVRRTSDDVLKLIEEGKTYIKEDPDRFYRAVNDVLEPAVAFDSFARGVMGPFWRDASKAQRDRFVDSFRWGLLRTYAAALTEFSDGRVEVLEPTKPPRYPDRREVKMEIHTSGGDIYTVLYAMALDKDGQWRVRNLIVGGVNIGLTYQNQFKSAMRDPKYGGSMDRVIDDWATVLVDEKEGANGGQSKGDAAGADAES